MNTDRRNAYEVLGLGPGATDEEIKGAYRARSLVFHPDRLAAAPAAAREVALVEMKAVNRAYALLKDPHKRAALDRRLGESSAGDALAHTRPGAAVDVGHTVARVRVEAAPSDGRRAPYAPEPPIFPPHKPARARVKMRWHPPSLADLRADVVRVVLFGLLTAPGWALVLVVATLLPALCGWAAALSFGVGLALALPWIKPPAKRRPLKPPSEMIWRGLLLALILAALAGVMILPQIMIALVAGPYPPGATLEGVALLAALCVAMAAHWAICLSGYFAA